VRGVKSGRAARAAVVVALVALGAAACDARALSPGAADQIAYLRNPASRRAALVASLVNADNGYSALRLARYGSGTDGDWERLEAWNPRVAVVSASELDVAPASALPADARALTLPDEATWEPSRSLEALGEEAFFRYPAQLAPALPAPLSRALAERYGWWLDDARGVGGLVRAEVASGAALAFSCATCHADVVDGRLVAGLPSARFDLGLLVADAGAADGSVAERLLAWGPGRVDVTTADASMPERISDLRPTRWLTHLQYDATVRQLDVVSLAIRIETLLITGHGQAIRPPRIVALALAQYLWSLGASLPEPGAGQGQGQALFAARCAGCHAGPNFTGPPRALAEVGTDPALGLSPERGTGFYRVPSLRGVASRPTLLHDGTLPDLSSLLDPARLTEAFGGGARGPGPVRGHVFGLDLPPPDREALLAFVRSL
jgi:hypothetical protein